MTYVPDHRKASKLDARIHSFSKFFKGTKGRKKHRENNEIERENRERSSEEKRLQELLEAEISRKRALLNESRGLITVQQSSKNKGKKIVREDSSSRIDTPLPSIYSSYVANHISPQMPESLTVKTSYISPRPLAIDPISSFGSFIQPPERPAPIPRQIPSAPSLGRIRSEPPSLPSHQQESFDLEPRHSESGPSTTNATYAAHSPHQQHTLENINIVNSTEAAETFLQNNNPYFNGTYRTYLSNKHGAGSEFIVEMEGSILKYEALSKEPGRSKEIDLET